MYLLLSLNLYCLNTKKQPSSSTEKTTTVDTADKVVIKVNEVYKLTLQSRGAMGLQLLYRCDDTTIVSINRIDPPASQDTMPKMGAPVPAIFEIRGTKPGKTKIVFYETRPWEKDFKEIIQKELDVEVN